MHGVLIKQTGLRAAIVQHGATPAGQAEKHHTQHTRLLYRTLSGTELWTYASDIYEDGDWGVSGVGAVAICQKGGTMDKFHVVNYKV